jgi:hypothetical protein
MLWLPPGSARVPRLAWRRCTHATTVPGNPGDTAHFIAAQPVARAAARRVCSAALAVWVAPNPSRTAPCVMVSTPTLGMGNSRECFFLRAHLGATGA